ncbi:MFS transporter [Rothia amarae]|uniref:MFS transporter n=1 Tax=Rothia amarae TaxID=169480 RepID=UPI0031DEF569
MRDTEQMPSDQRRLVVAGASVVAVSYGMARFALGLSTPRIVEDQVATSAEIGLASSLSFLTYVLACFVSSRLLNSGRWKTSVLLVLLTATVGTLMVAMSSSAPLFMSGIGVAGAAAGFTSGAIAYRLAQEISPAQEARAQSIANAGTGIGVAISTGILLAVSSWRLVFVVAAVLACVVCLWFLRLKTSSPATAAGGSSDEARGEWRALLFPILLTILMGAGSSVYWTYGRALAEEQGGLSDFQSLLFWGAIGVAGIGGALAGDVASRMGLKLSWTLCSVILGLSILCLPLCSNVVFAVLSGALFGAFYTVVTGLTIELGRQSWPRAVGAATGILFATIAVGQTAGSMLNGLALTNLSMERLFTLGGVATLVAGALIWGMKKKTDPSPSSVG